MSDGGPPLLSALPAAHRRTDVSLLWLAEPIVPSWVVARTEHDGRSIMLVDEAVRHDRRLFNRYTLWINVLADDLPPFETVRREAAVWAYPHRGAALLYFRHLEKLLLEGSWPPPCAIEPR